MPNYEGFPPARHVIDYLADYEQHYQVPVERPVRVDRVEWKDGRYRVHVGDQSWTAPPCRSRHRYLVYSLRPGLPRDVYRCAVAFGELPRCGSLPRGFRGGSGAANSAAQIAAELTGVAEVI